jgi:hypothetical protein
MKRWLAWLLVPIMALSSLAGITASAEDQVPDTADIQESVVTKEGERKEETLNDTLELILNTFHSDEFQELMKNPEVRDILSQGSTAVALWLLDNREVTIKILAELGVSERDQRVIGEIWDSAERLDLLQRAYMESADGIKLAAEIETLKNNPAFIRFCKDYAKMLESERLQTVLTGLQNALKQGSASGNSKLADHFAEEGVESGSPLGGLIMAILSFAELSSDTNDSLTDLMKEKDFWAVILHLANNRLHMDQLPILEELKTLFNNPDVMNFLAESGQNFVKILNFLAEEKKEHEEAERAAETGETTETNDGKEAE